MLLSCVSDQIQQDRRENGMLWQGTQLECKNDDFFFYTINPMNFSWRMMHISEAPSKSTGTGLANFCNNYMHEIITRAYDHYEISTVECVCVRIKVKVTAKAWRSEGPEREREPRWPSSEVIEFQCCCSADWEQFSYPEVWLCDAGWEQSYNLWRGF